MLRLSISFSLLILAAETACAAQRIPEVTCSGGKTTWVYAERAQPLTSLNSTIFEIVNSDLFITEAGEARYRYNRVRRPNAEEANRYVSAHYGLIFSHNRTRLTLVHSNEQVVRITSTTCKPR